MINPQSLVMRRVQVVFILLLFLMSARLTGFRPVWAQGTADYQMHKVEPGDTWNALGKQYGVSAETILRANLTLNPFRQPAIGSEMLAPSLNADLRGKLAPIAAGSLLEFSLLNQENPWVISITNNLPHPQYPVFNRYLFLNAADTVPRELPLSFDSLVFQDNVFMPGRAVAFKGAVDRASPFEASLGNTNFVLLESGDSIAGILGTGAFFPPGYHDLEINIEGQDSWIQPLKFSRGEWSYEDITLTGSAAAIDQQSIQEEWERLSLIWNQISPEVMWNNPFRLPLDTFLEYSSPYGAHRSYNGGPYRSYHEGVDFAAYMGTPVLAPAPGRVVLAEQLYVRGGAVLVDHGYGVFSGLYHLSSLKTEPGESVEAGQIVGEVGSTGLSTGNHLHWDLIIGGTQVDGRSWLDSDTACWILDALGETCG